jgi:hypothetical protein
VNCLAGIEVAIDCELRRRCAFNVASCADNFYARGDRGIALLFLTCAGRKLATQNAFASSGLSSDTGTVYIHAE